MQMQNSNAKIKNYKVIKGVNNLLHTRLSKTIFFGTKVKMMMMMIIIIITIIITPRPGNTGLMSSGG